MILLKKVSLKTKLISYTIFFIVVSILAMGFLSDRYLQEYFEKNAKEQIKENFFDLSVMLKQIERDLFKTLRFITAEESVIASMNLIRNYQDIENYNKILFDSEKKRIASLIAREGRYTGNEHIAVYDHAFRLVAFVDHEPSQNFYGYVSYEAGKPVYYRKYAMGQEFVRSSVPEHIPYLFDTENRLGGVEIQSGEVSYEAYGNMLNMSTNRSIFRRMPDGRFEVLGYMVTRNLISRQEINEMLGKESVLIDYFFTKGNMLHDSLIGLDTTAFETSPLFYSRYQSDELQLTWDEKHFYSAVRVPITDGVMYISAQVDKHALDEALSTSRLLLLVMLLLVVVVTFPVSLYILNKMVSEPLQKLLEGINIVSRGEYTHQIISTCDDELGEISDRFNMMAQKVRKREEELDELAHHDVLTRLPNRVMFYEQLDAAMSRSKRLGSKLAVLFVDLDEFKNVNDTMGHNVGDDLLVKVASLYRKELRDNDLLARIGGDEFNVLLEDIRSAVEAEEVAAKLINCLNASVMVNEEQLNITCSIGIAIFPDDATDRTELMKSADLAMYDAKASGRNRYHFYSAKLESELRHRTMMLKELRKALDKGEFELYYQPKFSLSDGKVKSAEALIRWNSPQLGMVRPDQFIPLAEESGEIVQIGQWVIEQACEDLARLDAMGIHLEQVSVNVSNVQFAQSDIVAVIRHALEKSGIDPHALEVEMTESYIHENSESALKVLHEIRHIGVDLAIDDFGTGYSSMSYLKRLPLSRLKIDKSFIDDIPYDEDDTEITKIIVALAKVMGLAITAEGVETLEQMHFLQQLGCDEGQGYLCSKPLPFEQFVTVLTNKVSCTAHHG